MILSPVCRSVTEVYQTSPELTRGPQPFPFQSPPAEAVLHPAAGGAGCGPGVGTKAVDAEAGAGGRRSGRFLTGRVKGRFELLLR